MCRKAGPPSSRGARSCEARWGRSARAGASPPPRPAAARALNRPAGAARAASHEGGRVAARRGAGPRMCRGLPSRAVICRRGGARRRVGGARPRARRGRAGAASRGAARRAAARAGSAAPLLMRRRSCLCVAGAGAGVTVMLVAQSPSPPVPGSRRPSKGFPVTVPSLGAWQARVAFRLAASNRGHDSCRRPPVACATIWPWWLVYWLPW